jgi:hypothetical protein
VRVVPEIGVESSKHLVYKPSYKPFFPAFSLIPDRIPDKIQGVPPFIGTGRGKSLLLVPVILLRHI